MRRNLKVIVFIILIFFVGVTLTINGKSKHLKQMKKYIKLIKKCEKITAPDKRSRCQDKFLKYFYNEMKIYQKQLLIQQMDSDKWKDVLQKILENNIELSLRIDILGKLSDQKSLYDIVDDPRNSETKKLNALSYIIEQEYLIMIAKNNRNISVRSKAVERIKDQKVLKEIALNDNSNLICMKLINRIEDQETLQNIILKNKNVNEYVINAVMNKINGDTSKEFLKKLSEHSSRDVQRMAQLKLIISSHDIQKLHGILDFVYFSGTKSKRYKSFENPLKSNLLTNPLKKKRPIFKVVFREYVDIKITDLKGKTLFYKKYKAGDFKKREIFGPRENVRNFFVKIDFTEIKNELLKKK